MENNGIFIYIEKDSDKKIAPVVFELVNKAAELSEKLNNAKIIGILPCDFEDSNYLVNQLSNTGFDEVYLFQNPHLKDYSTDNYTKVIVDFIQDKKPSIMLIGATTQGRDIAPRISSRLQTGLTADCTGLDINEKGMLAATRPTFGGNLMATILCKTFPQIATVRPNVFMSSENKSEKFCKFEYINVEIEENFNRVELIDFIKNNQISGVNLNEAELIITGGAGMKNDKGFKMLEELAGLLNASVGATRKAVDMGIAPKYMQIGQTGITVTPKVYIAVGVSGAVQHIVGMNGSDKIIAINKDKNAPIFKIADFSIVADAFDILPLWINSLR